MQQLNTVLQTSNTAGQAALYHIGHCRSLAQWETHSLVSAGPRAERLVLRGLCSLLSFCAPPASLRLTRHPTLHSLSLPLPHPISSTFLQPASPLSSIHHRSCILVSTRITRCPANCPAVSIAHLYLYTNRPIFQQSALCLFPSKWPQLSTLLCPDWRPVQPVFGCWNVNLLPPSTTPAHLLHHGPTQRPRQGPHSP